MDKFFHTVKPMGMDGGLFGSTSELMKLWCLPWSAHVTLPNWGKAVKIPKKKPHILPTHLCFLSFFLNVFSALSLNTGSIHKTH